MARRTQSANELSLFPETSEPKAAKKATTRKRTVAESLYDDLEEKHARFIRQAQLLFPGSRDPEGFESSRDRVFKMLRERNAALEPADRWKKACETFHQLHLGNGEPHRSWAARILNEDLTTMLAALHKAGLADNFTTSWPDQWL